ncbi:MAG TPA: cellulase family glycosylhydrolase [Pirellulales bacterium]|nr:cellulase family glycosylhydrolase [Pirellulales bacterium]
MTFVVAGKTLLGLNCMQPFGWGTVSGNMYAANPYQNGGVDSVVMSNARLAAIKAAGFDLVRLAVDPGTLLSAPSATVLNNLAGQIAAGVQRRITAGLKVLVDVHFMQGPPLAGWSCNDVIDGISGPKFKQMMAAVTALAKALSAFDPASVALELFNEPPPLAAFNGKTAWASQLMFYWHAIRGVLPNHFLVLAGTNYNALDNFQSGAAGGDGLTALPIYGYDANTGYSWHAYEPIAVAFQGEAGEYQDCHRLTFPPQNHPGGLAQATSDLNAAIDADATLSAAQKTQRKSDFAQPNWSFSYPPYFKTPQDANWLANRYAVATAWADKNKLARSQLGITELGIRGDLGANLGADPASMTAFLAAHKAAATAAGFGMLVIHELQNGDGFGVMNGNSFVPAVIQGLKLSTIQPTVTGVQTVITYSDGSSKTVVDV